MRRFVIATTLLICLLLAPGALAKAPRSFYGVMSANDPDGSEIARMGAGKVGTLRVNFVWGTVQPLEGAPYDWSHYDAIIGQAAQNGIRVLPTVYSSPAWAASRPNYPPSNSHVDDFRSFVSAAVARYGSGGTFWSTHPTIPALPVTWWQLWNEVSFPDFWYPKPSAKQYVGLLRVFHDAVKGADPTAKIVLAGLFPTPANGISLDRYLPAIYRRKAKPLFDAVAVHPYHDTPRGVLRDVQETRKIMARFKDKRSSLWITEVGWASGGSRSPFTVSRHRQAAYLRKAYGLLARNRGRMRIPGVIWYSWRDVPGGSWIYHMGLFNRNFDPKPSWEAFVGLTGGSATAPAGSSSPTGSVNPSLPLL